jgi:hypothetical protein
MGAARGFAAGRTFLSDHINEVLNPALALHYLSDFS